MGKNMSTGIQIGGANCWKQKTYGDIVITFDWVNDEPALLITPRAVSIRGAYVICLSSAYKYTEPKYLANQAIACANHIGMDGNSKHTIYRIADSIMECIQEMVEMPPERMVRPKDKGNAVGDISVSVNGKKTVEREMFSGDTL